LAKRLKEGRSFAWFLFRTEGAELTEGLRDLKEMELGDLKREGAFAWF